MWISTNKKRKEKYEHYRQELELKQLNETWDWECLPFKDIWMGAFESRSQQLLSVDDQL